MKLILGSGSPRRKDLLAQIGVVADAVLPPDIDETPRPAETPRDYCNRVARQKAQAIEGDADDIILCADTTVALGRRILGKPADAGKAAEFLLSLGGRRHQIITSVVVRRGDDFWQKTVVSHAKMKRLSDDELNAYLASGDWKGKAGGYGIQGQASAFIPWISGSFTGIVGLPLAETASMLQAAGYPLYKDTP